MVVTRSQGDIMEQEERRHADEDSQQRIDSERQRRLSLNPPASPTVGQAEPEQLRSKSPARSLRSLRSTASAVTRQRLAELEAAEKLAAIRKKELEIEAELIKRRLAAEVSAIHDDRDSLHEECAPPADTRQRVDDWLHANPAEQRGRTVEALPERRRPRCDLTPTRTKSDIEQLAETLERIARPRSRFTELPTFTGSPNEWLPFKAAMRDSTKMGNISPAENLQRLRSCLKGEARDAVAALLHTATDPEAVMKTLEQCFGRPEVLIDQALEEMKKLPKLGSSALELNNFAVKIQNVTCVLLNIDRRGYLYNPMLAREVLEKLSPHLRSRWCDYADDNDGTSEPEIVVLSRFLMREADRALKYTYAPGPSATHLATIRREQRQSVNQKRKPSAVYTVINNEGSNTDVTDGYSSGNYSIRKQSPPSSELKKSNSAVINKNQTDGCPCCTKAHVLPLCPNFMALPIDQRWELVRNKRLCFKCIIKKHRRGFCNAKSCGVNQCSRPHHRTLHQEEDGTADQEATNFDGQPAAQPATLRTPSSTEAVLSVVTPTTARPCAVLLKMCPVIISGPRGECRTHALLDEGATITLIDEDIATKIGAEGSPHPLHLHGVNMSQQERDSKRVTVQLRGINEQLNFKIQARTVKNLTLHKQSIPEELLNYKHLRDLPQDEVCYEATQPGILVGTDHWECIVSRRLLVGSPGQPAASRTQLGWVVHGTAPHRVIYNQGSVLHVYAPDLCGDKNEQHDRYLHTLVESHFRLEALGIKEKPRVSDIDRRAISIIERTIRKTSSGYEVGLPWRQDCVALPQSYDVALRRLRSLERKMDAAPEFAEEYAAQMENLFKKGYAVPCDGSEQTSPVCWFLPHFPVTNPNKPRKMRLVFDAASISRGTSLNDKLLEGPDLLQPLPGIVFRFRERPVAVTADIQEMFLRIKIRPQDQPAQQFLWRGANRTKPPRRYKMTSMIFGAASSPFTAHYVRNYNARVHARSHPRALETITRSHYMDDLVASYDDEEQARLTMEEVVQVHTAAGFTLRAWSSNHEEVLRGIPAELRATSHSRLGETSQKIKYWVSSGTHKVTNWVLTRQ